MSVCISIFEKVWETNESKNIMGIQNSWNWEAKYGRGGETGKIQGLLKKPRSSTKFNKQLRSRFWRKITKRWKPLLGADDAHGQGSKALDVMCDADFFFTPMVAYFFFDFSLFLSSSWPMARPEAILLLSDLFSPNNICRWTISISSH